MNNDELPIAGVLLLLVDGDWIHDYNIGPHNPYHPLIHISLHESLITFTRSSIPSMGLLQCQPRTTASAPGSPHVDTTPVHVKLDNPPCLKFRVQRSLYLSGQAIQPDANWANHEARAPSSRLQCASLPVPSHPAPTHQRGRGRQEKWPVI